MKEATCSSEAQEERAGKMERGLRPPRVLVSHYSKRREVFTKYFLSQNIASIQDIFFH